MSALHLERSLLISAPVAFVFTITLRPNGSLYSLRLMTEAQMWT